MPEAPGTCLQFAALHLHSFLSLYEWNLWQDILSTITGLIIMSLADFSFNMSKDYLQTLNWCTCSYMKLRYLLKGFIFHRLYNSCSEYYNVSFNEWNLYFINFRHRRQDNWSAHYRFDCNLSNGIDHSQRLFEDES